MILNIQPNGMILKEKLGLKLPDFTVLTGENGSGKTQLLNFLQMPYDFLVNVSKGENKELFTICNNQNNPIHNVLYSEPGLNNNMHDNGITITKMVEQWGLLSPVAINHRIIKDIDYENEQSELDALNKVIFDFVKSQYKDQKRFSESSLKTTTLSELRTLKKVSLRANKLISELTLIDFVIFYDLPTHIFSSSLDLLFHQFYLKQIHYKELTENISPPWVVLNEILERAKFRYRVAYTPSDRVDRISNITFINDEDESVKVHINSLSSGEKTIMSLVFALYHASNNGKFPELILFDEPDAHLHPSLTQLFLDVIEDVLVKEQKVKVILTTHSPSTVALAPEDSIYCMNRELGYPVKENKNNAVKKLSNGLASVTFDEGSLGIRYNLQNTTKHIVFTEGITDRIIIEIAWSKVYDDVEMPFFVQECYSASVLRNLFLNGEGSKGIFNQYSDRKLIALFDFDKEGYENWNRGGDFKHFEEEDPSKCLTISNKKNGYMMLLPVSNKEPIKSLAKIDNNETLKNKSKLTIESLFLNVPNLKETLFVQEPVVGGGSIYVFTGKKIKFTEKIKNLEKDYFNEFIPLFEKIKQIIED